MKQIFNHNASFLLLLLAYLSLHTSSATQIPLNNYLPPRLVGFQNQTCLLSGLGQTFTFNTQTNLVTPIIQDLEAACKISPQDLPLHSRLAIDSTTGIYYYYCPQNKSLLILDETHNYSVTGHIGLGQAPVFDEVKIKASSYHPGMLMVLGMVNSQNSLDGAAKNYTGSYLVSIYAKFKMVWKVLNVSGAHSEPIVDFMAISNNRIVAVGEKVYGCGEKLNTYYIGKWGDSNFDVVVDFYTAKSFGFVPQIKVTSDENFLIYSSEDGVFVYDIKTNTIAESYNVTLVTNNYTVNGEMIAHWEEIPFTVLSDQKVLYVYYQGNLTQYNILDSSSLDSGETVQIENLTTDLSYSRFFFFKNGVEDQAFIQMNGETFMLNLNPETDSERVERQCKETDAWVLES